MKVRFVWKIPVDAKPDVLWRYVSDTNRVNQYAGLPEFSFRYIPEPDGGSRQIGETRYFGWRLQWEEHPFEWIEGQCFEVIRSYLNGPIREFRTALRLFPSDRGTLLEQTLECEPRWPFVAPVIYWEVGISSRRRFIAAYRKIEQFLQGKASTPYVPVPREAIAPGRVEIIREKMANAAGVEYLSRLIQEIETLSDETLDKMRPFVFADKWNADRRTVLKLFLHASQAGLLDLSWDVICPSCRGAPERHQRLRDLRKQAHCPACNIEYTADFAESVEVTFRPNPFIRQVKVLRYCSGGPMNAPHVVVQQQLRGSESRSLDLQLSPWKYHLRSLKLQEETILRIDPAATASSAKIKVYCPNIEPETLDLTPALSLTIENTDDKPITVIIERVAGSQDAATAAMVIAMQEFRTLFSEEVLSPDTPISVGAVTLMFTDLKSSTMLYEDIGEAPAYGLVQRHFELLRESVSAAHGAIVKTIGDAVMAAFLDPAKAVEAAFEIHRAIMNDNVFRNGPDLTLKIGIHHGPCITVNQNDSLDYFGTTVNLAARVQKESGGGDIVVSDEIWNDSRVQEVLARESHTSKHQECRVRGLKATRLVHIIQPEP